MTNQEAIQILKSKLDGSVDTSYEWCECVRLAIKALETADAKPAKRGHWDYSEKENGECAWYFCSFCDEPAEQLYNDDTLLSEFCPHCGADMRNDSNLMETEGKVLAVGLGGSFKDSLIKTEVEGLYLNFEEK